MAGTFDLVPVSALCVVQRFSDLSALSASRSKGLKNVKANDGMSSVSDLTDLRGFFSQLVLLTLILL